MPGRQRGKLSGFTLLEVMVVLVLIGIIFGFAVLSLGGDDVAELMEEEARRLVTLVDMAAEEAVLRGEELALYVADSEYAFMALRQNRWVAIENDRLLKTRRLPAGIYLDLDLESEPPSLSASHGDDSDQEAGRVPQVYILSSGEMTPFTLTLRAPETEVTWTLKASILGKLDWEAGQRL